MRNMKKKETKCKSFIQGNQSEDNQINPSEVCSWWLSVLFYIDFTSSFTYKQFNFTERWAQPAISSEMQNCDNYIFRHNSQVKPGVNCFPLCGLLRKMHSTKYLLHSFFFSPEDYWMFWDADDDTGNALAHYQINNSGFPQQSVDIYWVPCHFFFSLFWLGNTIFNGWMNFSPHID